MVALLAAFLLSDTSDPIWNWLFIKRVWTHSAETEINHMEGYDTLARMDGDEVDVEITSPKGSLATAVEKAAQYAEDKNSSALIIFQDEKIIFERYWHGLSKDSFTNSMSMAKTLTALLIGIAIEDKAIGSEEDFASEYIEEWRSDARKDITIRHLLQMSSGLEDEKVSQYDGIVSRRNALYLGTNLDRLVVSWPLARSPGVQFEYNGGGTQALAYIIERAVKARFEDYLESKVWKAIGAADAQMWLDRPKGKTRAFCCVFATARSWTRIGQLFLNHGRLNGQQIVPKEWIRKMITPSPLAPEYGYQIWLGHKGRDSRSDERTSDFIAPDLVYLDGKSKQRVYIVPSQKLIIVRLGENAKSWDDSMLPNLLIKAIRD